MTSRRAAIDVGVLAALGGGIVAVSAWTAGWELAQRHPGGFAASVVIGLALYGAAALWVVRRRPPVAATLAVVVGAALLAGIVQVGHAPDISGDVHRYVWDGRVQAQGINPYRHAPDDPALASLRDEEVYPGINRKPVPTIYPPAAEVIFAGVYRLHPDSIAWTKLVFVLVAAVATLALARLLRTLGRRPEMAILFAWHPLVIVEVGRAGHVDVAAVLLVYLALLAHGARRRGVGGALLAAGALVKPYAAVMLPALAWGDARRRSWRAPIAFGITAVLAYVPFLSVGTGVLGYLPGYLAEEGFESGDRFHLLALGRRLAGSAGAPPEALVSAYEVAAALVLVGVLAWWWRRPPATFGAAIERSGGLLVAVLLLSSPTYPWYLILLCGLLPLMAPAMLWPAMAMAGAGELLYLQWWVAGSPRWPLDLVWGGAALALAASAAWRATRRRAATPPARAPAAARGPRLRAPRPSER